MKKRKSMDLTSRRNSFTYAVSGLIQLIKEEPNAKLHTIAAIAAIAAGFFRHISPAQWLAITIAIGMVWITEALNTCIEKLCDFSCDNKYHPAIKAIKDMAAGAVLVAAIISVVIAIIVFLL